MSRGNNPPVAEFPCLLKYVMKFCCYTICPLEDTVESTEVIVFTYRPIDPIDRDIISIRCIMHSQQVSAELNENYFLWKTTFVTIITSVEDSRSSPASYERHKDSKEVSSLECCFFMVLISIVDMKENSLTVLQKYWNPNFNAGSWAPREILWLVWSVEGFKSEGGVVRHPWDTVVVVVVGAVVVVAGDFDSVISHVASKGVILLFLF